MIEECTPAIDSCTIKPLIVITLGQTKSDNNNRKITMTGDFYLVIYIGDGRLKCDHIKRLSLYF